MPIIFPGKYTKSYKIITTWYTYIDVRFLHGVEQSEEGALLRGPTAHHIPAPHTVLARPHGRVAPNLTALLRIPLVQELPKHFEIEAWSSIQRACHTIA